MNDVETDEHRYIMAPRGTASTSSPSVSARRHSQRPTTAFPHRQGRGSPGASKSEDITIALATSFDASGWNTARHLVRPRWVIGRSHTVNPPVDITETDLGAGPCVHPGCVVSRIRVRRRMRACDETYLRDLRGSASVGNGVRQ